MSICRPFAVALLLLAGLPSVDSTAARANAGAPPAVVAVVPGAGSGAGHTFTLSYSDPDGASDISFAELLIANGTDVNGVGACYLYATASHFWLRDDTHGTWRGPVAAGSASRLANSQCSLAAAASSMASSGNQLTVTVTLTFTSSFVGPSTTYVSVTDREGLSSDWIQAGTWTVSPLNPGLDVVSSSCPDASKDPMYTVETVTEQGGRVSKQVSTPSCYPRHTAYLPQEGYFTGDGHPLPIMGRTCGHFNILALFVDTEPNRQGLLDNPEIPQSIKAMVAAGRLQAALEELFLSYTPTAVLPNVRAADAVTFTFSVALTRLSRRDLWFRDDGLGLPAYDAVLILDDLPGTVSGIGVRRWPWFRHIFNGRDGGYFLEIDPVTLCPGLFGNELLRRNLPVMLAEYEFGERTLVRIGNVTYERTPTINPRTRENIEPLLRSDEGRTPINVYIAGYADVDADGITDCVDPRIAPTADNVDADFIPDRFDPDLHLDHRPYSWMWAERSR